MLVSDIPALRNYFYPICYTADLTDAPRHFKIFGEDYVAFRDESGHAAAVSDR
jgi:phenylpropionate dioxygenase-like ring-hydroxylating dioxygenase large terminal subunit